MKLKIKYHNDLARNIETHGAWFDFRTVEPLRHDGHGFQVLKTSLGISVELPRYFEALIAPRSSLFPKHGLLLTNSPGVIDGPDESNVGYCGDNDIWRAVFLACGSCNVDAGDRVLQFRIQPSQKAPWWVKLKWMFNSGVEFVEVDSLSGKSRGGYGSTGR